MCQLCHGPWAMQAHLSRVPMPPHFTWGSRKAQRGDLQAGLVPGDIAHRGDAWPKPSTDLTFPNSCPSSVAALEARAPPKLRFHPCNSSLGREGR